MKVLHVTPSYIPAYRYGGPVKAVHELCRTSVKKGLDVTVFTTNIDWEKNLNIPINELQYVEGVKVFYYPVRHMRSYCYSKDLSRSVRKHIQEFDIVHIHSVYLYPTNTTAYWCRRFNIPYIINPFGALDPDTIKIKGRIKKILYINLIERRNIKKAAAVHTTSGYEKKRFLSLGFDTPVVTVPRGIEPEEYEKPKSAVNLREKYPELEGKKIILFLGRIHKKKGFDLLADAFKRVIKHRKDTYLVIAGSDENGYLDKVKKIFSRKGITKKVIFTGMLLGDDKLSAFYSSDIFVLPSYSENFGIAVLEAMTCRIPVVITKRVGLHSDVEEYKAGIITDCASDELANAIFELLKDENLRKSMGENGRRLIEYKFTLDKVTAGLIKVYNEIAKKE